MRTKNREGETGEENKENQKSEKNEKNEKTDLRRKKKIKNGKKRIIRLRKLKAAYLRFYITLLSRRSRKDEYRISIIYVIALLTIKTEE